MKGRAAAEGQAASMALDLGDGDEYGVKASSMAGPGVTLDGRAQIAIKGLLRGEAGLSRAWQIYSKRQSRGKKWDGRVRTIDPNRYVEALQSSKPLTYRLPKEKPILVCTLPSAPSMQKKRKLNSICAQY